VTKHTVCTLFNVIRLKYEKSEFHVGTLDNCSRLIFLTSKDVREDSFFSEIEGLSQNSDNVQSEIGKDLHTYRAFKIHYRVWAHVCHCSLLWNHKSIRIFRWNIVLFEYSHNLLQCTLCSAVNNIAKY
jgi:hypothetical protein